MPGLVYKNSYSDGHVIASRDQCSSLTGLVYKNSNTGSNQSCLDR